MYSMFNEDGIFNNGTYICLDVCNLDIAIEYIKNNEIKEIFISNFTGKECAIDFIFLEKLSFIEKLYINSDLLNISNIETIYNLRKLKDLVWFCIEPLDTSKFKKLDSLAINYPENIKLHSSIITKLEVSYLESIESILGIEHLEKLTLRNYKGIDISLINELIFLSNLSIKVARKLNNIESISYCSKLENLEFENIRKDLNLEPLSECDTLKELYIYNKIKNCQFIENMKNINLFLCKEILNGDLSPIFKNNSLKYVKLLGYKKYYNYSKVEFENRFKSW